MYSLSQYIAVKQIQTVKEQSFTVPRVGLLFVIVVLPGHSHLLSMNDNSVSTVRAEYYVILKLRDFSVYKKGIDRQFLSMFQGPKQTLHIYAHKGETCYAQFLLI